MFVIHFLQCVDQNTLFLCQVGEEFLLDDLWLFCFGQRVRPAQSLQKALRVRQERRLLPSDEIVTPTAVLVIHAPWEGKNIAIIVHGQFSRDERAALHAALHHDAGIAQASHDAVAAHKVLLVGSCARRVFRQQSPTLMHHVSRRLSVQRRIDDVESVSQHPHSAHAALQGCTVGTNVNAVCQTAHNDRVGVVSLQVSNKVLAHFASVCRAFARTHNVDDAQCVQVSVAIVK